MMAEAGRKTRVLIIDDHPIVRSGLAAIVGQLEDGRPLAPVQRGGQFDRYRHAGNASRASGKPGRLRRGE